MIEPDFISRFTTHLKEALQKALSFAVQSGRELVEPGDLVVGLLSEKGSIGAELFTRSNVTREAAEKAFRGTPDEARKGGTVTPDLSPPVKRILERAILTAHLHEHKYVGTEHLAGAIVGLDLPDVQAFLKTCGADAESLKQRIESVLASTSKFPDVAVPSFMEDDAESLGGPKLAQTGMRGRSPASALDAFARELTCREAVEKLDPVVGRDRELDRVIEILCRRTKNNPVLLGDPGVGKTAIVEGLAQRIAAGDVPDALHGKRVCSVDLALAVAGTMYRGEFEARLKQLVDEAKADPDVILFIDEVHNLVGAGSTSGSLDAANILKPALARGEIRCIGATTWSEYKKHVEPDAALERRFQPVAVEEPTVEAARAMLEGVRARYAEHHGVAYDNAAIEAAVSLADRYLTDRKFPDKAIDLIDEAAASVIASRRNRDVIERLRTLELAQNETAAAKEAAVRAEKLTEASAYRLEEAKLEDQRAKLEAELAKRKNEKPLTVRAEDVAAVVARIANVPLSTVLATERERMRDLAGRLKERIIGQDDAIAAVADAVRKARLGLGDARRPKASFLFAGPSGIGKTELARTLAKELFGREDALIKIDMSEFAEGYGASKLLGSPAGYVGYRDGNAFTDAIRKKPHCVVCFDEVEKAHADVLNLLLQILEDGRVTDATGRPVSFRQAYVVLTSNVGSDAIGRKSLGFGSDERDLADIVRKDVDERFRPELLNRLDRIVVFRPLAKEHLRKIVKRELSDALSRTVSAQRIACEAGDDVVDWLLDRPMPEKEGARAARRIVEREITDLIARLLAEKPTKRKITLKATKQGLKAL